jgi:dTDP-4-dehydrorhamnose 3,5-epimerase
MKILETRFKGLLLIEPDVFEDDRGWFMETWNQRRFEGAGLKLSFVQDNVSFSKRGVLRGLHFQNPDPQGKLVSVLQGSVFDVVVDLRRSSPTFGRSFAMELSSDSRRQIYIPEGFAHGFVVLSETARFFYKCTALYNPAAEHTLLWNDPDLGIDWPVQDPLVSDKDNRGLPLKDFAAEELFP